MPCQRSIRFLFTLVAILVAASTLQAKERRGKRQPIARLDKEALYEEDLFPLIGGQLLQLQNQEYELKMKALTDLINRRLLEGEAQRNGISMQELLAQVDRNLRTWSVSEVEGFYLARRDLFLKTFEEF